MLLQGRVILDCSILLPGPFLGKLLAQQGAHVIKIENPDRPDPARKMNAYFNDLNDCKEVVWLDPANPKDRPRFEELVKKADGLIEGFRPLTKKKLGLDEQTLHSINPQLCIASLIGYPEEGPWRDRAGHDLNFQAITGCLSLFGEMPALPLADLFAASSGALSMAAALDGVARGGSQAKGIRVVVSMSQTLKNIQSVLIKEYQETKIIPRPHQTFFSGVLPSYRIYTAKDGRRISVGAIELKFWTQFCSITGLSHLVGDGGATGERGQAVSAQVARAIASRDWSNSEGTGWDLAFADADCCVEPVLDYSEVYGGL